MKPQFSVPSCPVYDPRSLEVFVDGDRMHGFYSDCKFTRQSSKCMHKFIFNLSSSSVFVEKLMEKVGKIVELEVKYDTARNNFDFGAALSFHGAVEVECFSVAADSEEPIVSFTLSNHTIESQRKG